MAGYEGFLVFIKMVLLLQTSVLSKDLRLAQYDKDFKGITTLEEERHDDVHGLLGVTDYNNNIFHSWEIFAPGHSSTGSKKYTFLLHIHKMEIPHANEIEIDGHGQIRYHAGEDPNRCLDFVQIDHHKYCGYLTLEEEPLRVVVKHVNFVRVDFGSDDSITGHGFLATYTWFKE